MNNSTYQQLCRNLEALKLPQMQLHLSEVADFVSANSLSFSEGLLKLTNFEADYKAENVYFIDGESLFRGPFEDCCTVDGCHPNDLGFSYMAEAVTCVLKRIIRDGKMNK